MGKIHQDSPRSKTKIGLRGSYEKPTEGKEAIEAWKRNDYMVVSWILSSISKEIAEAFLFANSAKDLWTELEARFGDSNGPPTLPDSKRNCLNLTKGHDRPLDPLPECSCGASKKLSNRAASYQLMQFLMDLSDAYDHVRNQILLMNPLATAAKDYSMVHRVEKQRQVNSGISELEKEEAMAVRTFEPRKQGDTKRNFKKWPSVDKRQMQCDYYKKKGHLKEGCFELIGFPDWYKAILDQRKAAGRLLNPRAMNARTEQEMNDLQAAFNTSNDKSLSEIIKKEALKVIQDQSGSQISSNFSEHQSYAGMTPITDDVWIIDSGASAHMCASIKNLWTRRVVAVGKQQRGLYVLAKDLPAHILTEYRMTTPLDTENVDFDICNVNKRKPNCDERLWHNRLPAQNLDWKSPYELLYNRKPMYDHIRVFGCLFYITNVLPFKRKFEPKAQKCIFLGYVQGMKGYKVMDLTTGNIHVSRDIVFHEDSFPFEDTVEVENKDIVCPLPIITEHNEINNDSETDIVPTAASQEQETDDLAPRRSTRLVRKPVWTKDYECCNADDPTNLQMTPAHSCFVGNVSNLQEPKSYMKAQDNPRWKQAMKEEINALERNKTWRLTDLPQNKKVIG
ncbi:UNVERIFIED_CONTAM: hypothetical protein Sindi_1324200 [Sesamum indicum]